MKYPPLPQKDWVYFLDFDGTIVDIADRPEGVRIRQELVHLLVELDQVTKGALVLVSGRSISDLDGFLKPLRLRAAGLHGSEYRLHRDGEVERCNWSVSDLDPIRPLLSAFAAKHDRIQLEDKSVSLAIHYRRVPEQKEAVRKIAEKACGVLGAAFTCLAGKMVYEIKPRDVHKGQVIERFMAGERFHGRRLVFVGDDVTDEDGFRACNMRGGVSVRVGAPNQPTEAHFRLTNVEDVEAWLGQVV
jgi:trehalose 6-phosphate phosphatase